MIEHYETRYSIIKQTIKFNSDELQLIKILLDRSNEYGEVRKFDDLDYNLLEELELARIISLHKGIISIDLNIALPLVEFY